MNVLIIDDEPIILNDVFRKLSSYQIPLISEIDRAGSARAAREKMKEKTYDIFLCDIVMPEEDGISFAKWAVKESPESKIIFLTAHADYAYMKEAIAMHSFDYLLQPASADQLRDVVERAIAQIHIEEKNRETLKKGTFYEQNEERFLAGNALRYIKAQDKSPEFLQRYFQKKRPAFNEQTPIGYLYIEVYEILRNRDNIDDELMRVIYENIMDEIMTQAALKSRVLIEDDTHVYVFLIPAGHILPDFSEWESSLEHTIELFERIMNMKIAVYTGRHTTLEKLPHVCEMLHEKSLDNIKKESRVFLFREKEDEGVEISLSANQKVWQELLNRNDISGYKKGVFHFIHRMERSEKEPGRKELLALHRLVTEQILSYMVENNIKSSDVFNENLTYREYLRSYDSLDHFGNAVAHICSRLQAMGESPQDSVEKAIWYVRENLDKNLSVAELADLVGMNARYFTGLFKEKTGYNLKEYITKEKMASAKTLLASTDMSITAIAGRVGYDNYSNFIRSFKQETGMTPNEYKKSQINSFS